MIEVTERAREELKKALEAQPTEAGNGLRLSIVGPDEFGLGVDEEREGDAVIEHDGSKVLIVESALAEMLTDVTIDVHDSEAGPRLVMAKPQ